MLHLLVTYDVSEDKRRARLAKRLRGAILRVQKSVFEGPVPESRLEPLRKAIRKEIDLECDSARVYSLCARCRVAVEVIGSGVYVEDESQRDIVF